MPLSYFTCCKLGRINNRPLKSVTSVLKLRNCFRVMPITCVSTLRQRQQVYHKFLKILTDEASLLLLVVGASFQNARGCWTRTWHAHDDDDDLVSESNIYNHNFVASRETIFQNNLACACVLFSKQSSILTWTGDTELSGAMAATPFILLWHCDHHHHYCYCYISEAVVIKIFVILFCQFFFTIATLVGR